MISLRDDFDGPDYEACLAGRPGAPCPPEDVEMWAEVFAVLRPTPAELGETEG